MVREVTRVNNKRRRGIILIIATWIMLIVVTVTLVLGSSVRVEMRATANRVAQLQADEIEKGAEQWVMCETAAMNGDAVTVVGEPAQAVKVGDGYFWLLRPVLDDTDDNASSEYDYGIVDEGSKLNLNYATAAQIVLLPGITQEACDSIVDWIDTDDTVTGGDGAEDTTYMALPIPYHCKNAPLESVEELLLVQNVTPDILYGQDLNQDGVLDGQELSANGGNMTFTTGGTTDPRGLLPFITVYTPKVTITAGGGGRGGATQTITAQVNVNTAPAYTLMALGLTQQDADTLVSTRDGGSVDTTTTTWVTTAIGGSASTIANYITATSNVYSADIVAVAPGATAFRRVRIVVDASQTTPVVLFRKDLTDLGWPLDPQIKADLKAGKEPEGATQNLGLGGL